MKKEQKSFFLKPTVVLAHRGDSHHYPENTLPAFEAAEKMGVDLIETDVHITADGEVIVWHDVTLERMSGLKGLIPSLKLDEVMKADAGFLFSSDGGSSFPFRGKGVQVVLFEQLLKQLPTTRFNVDLKDKSEKLVNRYCEILNIQNASDRVCTASFHDSNLKLFRRLMPDSPCSFTQAEVVQTILLSKSGLIAFKRHFRGDVFQGPDREKGIQVATPRLIKALKKRGIPVHIWTINDAESMHRLLDMGVDGIFTDNPSILQQVLKDRKKLK